MNPLTKIRSGVTTAATKVRDGGTGAWRASRDGTTRTAGWIKNGVGGAARKARWRVSSLVGRSPDASSAPGSDAPDPDAPGVTSASAEADGDGGRSIWERTGVAGVLESARSNSRVAIAWAVLGFLVLAWIGWAIYVTAENGATAGLGVVISWPAVFAALALVATPFVVTWMLVQRHRIGDAGPALAGAAQVADQTSEPGAGSDENDAPEAASTDDAAARSDDAEEESDTESEDEGESDAKEDDGGEPADENADDTDEESDEDGDAGGDSDGDADENGDREESSAT